MDYMRDIRVTVSCRQKELVEKDKWNKFVAAEGTIFASYDWVLAQAGSMGIPLFFVAENCEGICGVCAVISTKLWCSTLTGRFTIQGNPIVTRAAADGLTVIDLLLEAIEKEARRRRVLKIEWNTLWSMWEDRTCLLRHGYEVRDIVGWIIDLTAGETVLHSNMRSSYRNLKNQAEKKHGIRITECDEIGTLYKLWQETYKRAGKIVGAGSFSELESVYRILAPYGMARVFLASRGGVPLSGSFTLYHGKRAYYWHGGSVSGERFGASQLLQWNIIRHAQGNYEQYHMGGSWGEYDSEKARSQVDGIDGFKHGIGARQQSFCLGSKGIAPFRESVYACCILPLLRRWRAFKSLRLEL
jgi:hypothetical protein